MPYVVATSDLYRPILATGVKGMDGLAPDTPLVFVPGAKAPAVGGVMSLSRARYLVYSAAVTVAEFRALHPGTAAEARRDFRFDATRGHVTSPGLSHSVVHAVRTAFLGAYSIASRRPG